MTRAMHGAGCLALALLAQAGPGDAAAAAPDVAPVYAALPLRNLTADPAAAAELLGLLRAGLEARGARFVSPGAVEDVLRARRVRYTDSVSVADAAALAEDTGARYLLLGTLLASDRADPPRLALAARVIDAASGERVHSGVVSLRGEEFAGLLGLGAIDDWRELAGELVARLLLDFDGTGAPRPLEQLEGAVPRGRRAKLDVRFVREGFDAGALERIAVFPLTNRTPRADAGLRFAEILDHAWFRGAGVSVVEPSELRAAMVREKVRSIDDLDLELLRRIAASADTRYLALGSMDHYDSATFVAGEALPELEASIRILDLETGVIAAAARVRRRGDDYHRLLGLGTVRDLVGLSLRSAHELVGGLHR